MQTITFTNKNGNSIVFSPISPFVLENIDGAGAPEIDLQMQKAPFQDGKTYIDTLLQPRPLSIEVSIIATSTEDLFAKKGELCRILNPKLGEGTFRYDYYGGMKYIQAVPDPGPIFPKGADNRGPNYQKVLLPFLCPNPYWLDEETTSEPMIAFSGAFSFPFSFPVEFGSQGYSKTLTNNGHVSTPVQIEFTGPITNPKVTNETTGEYIKLNRSLLTGEKLVVDTTFGSKSVEIVHADGTRTNVFNWIDINSTFFQLIAGENLISYFADAGRETALVTISWRDRYIGV